MSLIKTLEEIEALAEGGAILSRALGAAKQVVRPGASLKEIDATAEAVLVSAGATPSFKGYASHSEDTPFPSTMCISVNEEVVHGIGSRDRLLQEGDIVGLDIGCWYKGLCTDMAITVPVGEISEEKKTLLRVTENALQAGIQAALSGKMVADISRAVEETIAPHGFGIVRDLVGHGVGHAVHEAPQIPNFTHKRAPRVLLSPQMCIAIEPMVTLGDYHVETADDGWAIVTRDGSASAHFEMTIAILPDGPRILTPFP